LLLDR